MSRRGRAQDPSDGDEIKLKCPLRPRRFHPEPTKVDSTVNTRKASSSDTPPTMDVFRFLDLPGEQCNQIYRNLFDNITTPNEDFRVWSNDPPRYDGKLATYSALARTSEMILGEIGDIWKLEYLSNLTLYFHENKDFIDLCGPSATSASFSISSPLKVSPVRFLLRTPIEPQFFKLSARRLLSLMADKDFAMAFHLDPEILFDSRLLVGYSKPLADASQLSLLVADGDLEYRTLRQP